MEMAGDGVVTSAAVTMTRAFTVPGTPDVVFPWIVQLGKHRAGWYLPRRLERIVPRSRRAIRQVDARQMLSVGDVVPDYGGRDETFTVVAIDPPTTLVYESWRGRAHVSWAITLAGTGELLDVLTIAAMAAGLRERLTSAGADPDGR